MTTGGKNMTDYEKITSLVSWERQTRIRYAFEDLKNCYWEDATVTTSWSQGAAGNYIDGSKGRQPDTEHPILNRTGNPIVHQNGNRAYTELPSTTIRWISVNGKEAVLVSYMRLIYSTECRNGEWKISDMCAINEGDTLNPVVAGEDLQIDHAKLNKFRHAYRNLAYVRSLNEIEMSDDLLGIDRPEEVDRLYQQKEEWLKEA